MAEGSARAPARKHMPDRVSIAGVAIGAIAVAVGIAFSAVIAFALLHVAERSVPMALRAAEPGKPPLIAGPVALQPMPAQDIAVYLAEKQRLRDEYAWVDREHGVVRIPIEQAMALLARERAAKTAP